MEKFDIVLRLKSNLSKNSKGVFGYVVLDDTILSKFTFTASEDLEQRFSVELPEGPHKFGFTLNNKSDKDTIVDSDGTIIDDTLVSLEYFEIDEIELTEMFKLRGKFMHSNQEYDPKVNTSIGHNGSYYIEFDTPYYEWLLSNI